MEPEIPTERYILLRRWDSPKALLLITAIFYLVFIFLTARGVKNDFSYFVTAGDKFCNRDSVPRSLTVLLNSSGYDGQFYYRLALDPFTSKVIDFGITLDRPAYRQQRILYPLIVWALSLGCIDCVPALMVVVNFIGLCVLGWLGGLFARHMRLHCLWGLAFPLYPGFLLTLSRDLAEILYACLLLATLLCVRHQKYLPAALLFIAAILTRETALLVAVGAISIWLNGIWNQKSSYELPRYFLLSAFLVYWIWQSILLYSWGYKVWDDAHRGAVHRLLGWPFVGFFSILQEALHIRWERIMVVDMLLIVAFAAAVVWSMRSSMASGLEKTSWVLYAVLAFLLTKRVWVQDWSILRALAEFYVLGAIILLGSPSKMKVPVLGCWGTVWLFYFLQFTHIMSLTPHGLMYLF